METKHGGGRVSWHPAFLQAIQQELFDYRDSLVFKYEYQLASEPLRVDLLIVKKPKNVIIDKNIARIFRTYNLLEYKSPDDYLSVNDYLKVYAYACLYAAITPDAALSDITLTFIGNRHPRKLLRYLTGTRGYRAEEISPGIRLVSGDYVPIQIIESRKLPERENLWLKSLANDLRAAGAGSIIDEACRRGNKAPLDAYLDVLLRANARAFLEAEKMAGRKRETFEEVFTKAGYIPEWIERGRVQGLEQGLERGRVQGLERGKTQGLEAAARNAVSKGLPVDVIHEITGLDVETIKSLGVR